MQGNLADNKKATWDSCDGDGVASLKYIPPIPFISYAYKLDVRGHIPNIWWKNIITSKTSQAIASFHFFDKFHFFSF